MTLQLTYPTKPCVRCHRATRGQRLCTHCIEADELMTRQAARALKHMTGALSVWLGYTLDQTEATTDWYDHRGAI